MDEIIERLKECIKRNRPILIRPEDAHLILVLIEEYDYENNIYRE